MEFSVSWLESYLAHRLGTQIKIREQDIKRYPRGSSRETWFVSYCKSESADNQPKTVVFRLDFPGGSTDPSPLDQEYFIYERLGHTSVPIAKALWWEDNPAWTDQPFYVREHIEGSWEVPHFLDPDPRYDELRIEISKEHLRKLALVHQVDWRNLGFDKWLPAPTREEECAKVYVDTINRTMDEIRVGAIPIFLETSEWLIDHAPVAPGICLCKGTNGLGEEIFRGREIVAMSDWEEASIGDPAADFAFMQNFVPELERNGQKLWGLGQALDYYYSVSGIRITREAVDYYHILRFLKMLLFSHKAATAVHRHPHAHIRQAWTGTEVEHIAKRLAAAALEMLPSLPPERFIELNESV